MNSKVATGSRLLLGLIFLIFGSNGLMMVITGSGFIPMPPPNPMMAGFFTIAYLMPLVKTLQVISALFLLSNKFVNLALVLLTPIVVNILAIHIFIDLAGLPMALFLVILLALQFKHRWNDFSALIKK
ncbi:MAG: hypothetical protein ACJAT2_002523 [Bacteriovoracaceae bacterium]|jgi:hypothetical protein